MNKKNQKKILSKNSEGNFFKLTIYHDFHQELLARVFLKKTFSEIKK